MLRIYTRGARASCFILDHQRATIHTSSNDDNNDDNDNNNSSNDNTEIPTRLLGAGTPFQWRCGADSVEDDREAVKTA